MPTFEPFSDDFASLLAAFTGHFEMERKLLDGVVAKRGASSELVKQVVNGVDGKSEQGAVFFVGAPMRARADEQKLTLRDVGPARDQLQEVPGDGADGKVSDAIAAPSAEETVGSPPRSVGTGPAVVA